MENSSMKTWIKAGLIGGVVGMILTLPAFLALYLPMTVGALLSTCVSVVFLLLYPGIGVLAAFWLPAPRTPKQGAIDGALAGLLGFAIDGLATVLMYLIVIWTGGLEQYMQQLVPYANPEVLTRFNTVGMSVMVGCSCLNVLFGVMTGAAGGWVFASIKPD
jgi:hypothetical protein